MTTETTALATVQPVGTSIMANWIAPASIDQGLRLADMMAKAKLMPEHLRGDPGSCLLVLEQASRWGMSPFAVAQCTAVVRGKLCFEGKLVAAVLVACGAITGRLSYTFSGEGQGRTVVVSGLQRGEKKPVTITGTVRDWATQNDSWKKDPDAMLVYRGTRHWARIHAPEAMLGVYTPDELDEGSIDITPTAVVVATPVPAAPKEIAEPEPAPAKKANGNGAAPAPSRHPAIVSLQILYRNLGKIDKDLAGRVYDRVCRLFDVDAAPKIPADQMEALTMVVGRLNEHPDDIETMLAAWEEEKTEKGAAK